MAELTIGQVPTIALAYLQIDNFGNHIVEFRTGTYNASMAQAIAQYGCTDACSQHVPLRWSTPVPIATYGAGWVQALTLATGNSLGFDVAVAVSSNNSTELYASGHEGAAGTWTSLTGTTPVWGYDPQVSLQGGCSVFLTVLNPNGARETKFTLVNGCQGPGVPNYGGGHRGGGAAGGQFGGSGLPAPPTITEVVPQEAEPGTNITINGTGFSTVQQVLFGKAAANFTIQSATLLRAIVPQGSGTVNVSAWNPGGWSAQVCDDEFAYGPTLAKAAPQIETIAPQDVAPGQVVIVTGVNLGIVTGVSFGISPAAFTVVSPTELSVTVPPGGGLANVTVSSTGGTSLATCAGHFAYEDPPEPVVTGIAPYEGPAGTTVIVSGANFDSNATVLFGSSPASSTYENSGQISATSPSGSGAVSVVVSQWGGFVSPTSCADAYTYEPSNPPLITSLSTNSGQGNSTLTIDGTNLGASSTVYIGGVAAGTVGSSGGSVNIPQGLGVVTVEVVGGGGSTPITCSDQITITGPGMPNLPAQESIGRQNFTLPVFSGAALVPTGYSPDGFDLFAVNATGYPGLNLYEGGGSAFAPVALPSLPDNESVGSPIFNSIGGTQLTSSGLSPGEVAAASSGNEIFVAMTTDNNGRTAIATLASNNGGQSFSGPYLSAGTGGSIADPSVAISPIGNAYVTWLTGSAADWTVELAVYSPSGAVLQTPQAIGPSGLSLGAAPGPASIIVDPNVRPIVMWTEAGANGSTTIEYTGAFLSPVREERALSAGFNSTTTADFENFGQPGLSQFQTRIALLFTDLSHNLSVSNACDARHDALWLYTNLTWIDSSALVPGPEPSGCIVVQGPDNSILANTYGAGDPNFYLSVASENLLESLGVGLMPSPPWDEIGWAGVNSPPGAFTPGTTGTYQDAWGDSASTFPWTVTPDSIWLDTRSNFPGMSADYTNTFAGTNCGSSSLSDQATSYQVQVQINGGPWSPIYSSSTNIPAVYVSNLTAMQTETWAENVVVGFSATNVTTNTCPPSDGFHNGSIPVAPPTGWPSTVSFSMSGTYTTGLDPFPSTLVLNSTPGQNPGLMSDTLNWTNTIDADANLWLNGTTCSPGCNVHWSNSSYQLGESASGQGLQAVLPNSYSLTFQLQSAAGLGNWSWSPLDNALQVSTPAPVETVQVTCTFQQQSNPSKTWVDPSTEVSGVTGTAAILTWYSLNPGFGWLTFNATNGGMVNQTAQEITLANGSAEYVASLHGLEPWAIYEAIGHVEVEQGCTSPGSQVGLGVQYSGATSAIGFQTVAQVPLEEQDYPYDSISKQGGGAVVFWRVPTAFQNSATFKNGSLTYYPSGVPANLTILPLQPPLPEIYSVPGTSRGSAAVNTTYGLNLTGLTGNTQYVVNVTMNFTLKGTGQTLVVTGEPYSFTYEKDTSGDGLTDWEKEYGWNVTYDPILGWLYGWDREHVSANPALFATNGLVGDYVEKEYGLNPNTVDTSGSHMLDTWNLTFNLRPGSGNPPKGSNFQNWNAGASYNPFAATVQYTPGHFESGRPIAQNISNMSASASGGVTSGDGAPWAAEALWSYSALEKFVNLSGVKSASWLRGIVGSWDGIPTLTVEGKLSWGANPLATSTPTNNLPDGQRVNPLTEVGIEFGPVYANVSGLSSGTGFAVKMTYSNCEPGYGCASISNYSTNATVGAPLPWPSWVNGYSVLLPVSQAYSDTIKLQIVANESGGNLVPLALNGSKTAINVTCNAILGTCSSIQVSGNSANLHATMQFVPVGIKAPTWLWVPTDNSTVNGLPIGLERYTGEQSFDLVVANVSAAVSSAPVPLPWGGTTTAVTLSSGLNDFLVPRAQLQNSPLGQAIFLGLNTSYSSSAGAPPLVGTPEQSLISGFSGSNYMVDLGAYWQNRAIATGPGNITGSSESGTPLLSGGQQNPLVVQVTAVKGAGSGANEGGLPSAPALYNSSDTPAAVQSIITLNVTSTATLDLLLAGLMDNVTGGVNGTIQSVTYQIPFMGFDRIVANAISNASRSSKGLYGPPGSHFTLPISLWSKFWNAVSSVIETATGAILSLATIAWSALLAAATYLNHIAAEAGRLGGQVWARASSTLVSVGKAIASALRFVLAELSKVVTALLNTALNPYYSARASYGRALDAAVDPSGPAAVWEAIGGALFVAGITVAIVVVVAMNIVRGIDFGASFVLSILVGLILAIGLSALQYLMPGITSPSPQMVSTLETFSNGYFGQTSQGPNWTSMSNAFSYWENGASDTYAFAGLKSAWADTSVSNWGFAAQAYSLTFAIIGSALAFLATSLSGGNAVLTTDIAIVLAGVSVVLEIPGLKASTSPRDHTTDLIIFGLDISDFGLSIAELSKGE